MNDLERSVRETLAARVNHLTDDRLAADVDRPTPQSQRRSARSLLLPLAAAAVVAAVAVGVAVAVHASRHPVQHRQTQPPARHEPSLVDTQWQLDSQTLGRRTQQTTADVSASLIFGRNGAVSGETGCNQFTGQVSINGARMRFGPLKLTAAKCVGHRAATEAAFNKIIPAIDHWSVTGAELRELRLTGPGGVALTFRETVLHPLDPVRMPLAQGPRGAGNYVFGYTRSSQGGLMVQFEWFNGDPNQGIQGTALATAGLPEIPAGCQPTGGHGEYVFGSTRLNATKIVYRDATATATLTLYPIPNAGRVRAFGGFVENTSGNGTVTAYGPSGNVMGHGSDISCS